MITKDNLRELLTCLGFQQSDSIQDVVNLHFDNINCTVAVDFTNEKIIYPEGIEADRDTTKNFSANENFVVLECVIGLLAQGYRPENIVLEPKTPGGREDSHFYCDILIRDNDKRPYMLIECKTMDGKEDDEFSKAWKKTLQDGGQLFNYYNTYRQAQYLVLYASDFIDGKPCRNYRLITMTDNKEYLESNPKLISFEKVSADNGTRDDFFKVWSETYGKDYATNGAFEADEVPAFGVTKKKLTIDDLIIVDGQDIQRKYHQFAQTLRQYNVASHENAFDKLVNLFLVKVVDEVRNPKDLQFLWKGAAYDDYYSFQDRLQKLYQIGMKDYLGEDVTYIDNASIENAFRMQRNDPDAIKDTILEYFRQLKFYSNSDFGFLDVHNRQLFVQNAVILKAMVEMLQDMRLKTNEQNQFLGDLFEGFLDQGVKQNEGQFFTPTPITRFMVSSLPLEQIICENTDIPKAIDYACGAGHFLNEYASQIKPFVEKYKGEQSLPDFYKQIYGIEKEYRLSKVSKVSSFMYGQDGIQIVYGDALISHEAIKDGDYKVLIANPPYSVTGFLATLNKEERDAYMLSAEVDSKQFETNNSIETFFIERAKQLLAPEGVAAIILPSSILSNSSNIYVKTREILLQYFDFVAIAEFGSGTFGKTGTNTVVLFIRRKKSEPELATHYRNRVEAWFSNNHGQDHRYEDVDAIERYAQHIGVPYEEYMTLLEGNPSDELMKHEIFAAYHATFSDNTAAKNIKKKKLTARYTQAMKDAELAKHILDAIRSVEKDKLFYFMLCESNSQPVVVMKSPTKTADTKRFLGYEWSNRKGSEGIKYLGAIVEDDDNDISANKGIQQIQTPLFDPQNLANEEKINTLIRKNYLGEDVVVPEDLCEFVNIYNLQDMIEFTKTNFDKAIKTSVEYKINIESKYPISSIDEIVNLNEFSFNPTKTNDEFIYVDISSVSNGKINYTSVIKGKDAPSRARRLAKKNSVLISTVRPNLRAFAYVEDEVEKAIYSTGFAILRSKDESILLPKYLYYLFMDYESTMMQIKAMMPKGMYPSINSANIKSIRVPLPPLDIQKKIAEECKKVDEEYKYAEESIVRKESEIKELIRSMQGSTKPISSILKLSSGNYLPANKMRKGNVPVYGGNGITGYHDTGFISEQTIVIGRVGEYCGSVYLTEPNCWITDNALYSKEFLEDVNKVYLMYALRDANLNQYANRTGQPNVSQNAIANVRIVVPSKKVQDECAKQLLEKQNEINTLKLRVDSCTQTQKAILDKYLK